MGDCDRQMTLKEWCHQVRGQIEALKVGVKKMRDHPDRKNEQTRPWQNHDIGANIELALRHLEDARMRLGKVIQEMGDGVSVYDKK